MSRFPKVRRREIIVQGLDEPNARVAYAVFHRDVYFLPLFKLSDEDYVSIVEAICKAEDMFAIRGYVFNCILTHHSGDRQPGTFEAFRIPVLRDARGSIQQGDCLTSVAVRFKSLDADGMETFSDLAGLPGLPPRVFECFFGWII